MTPPSKTRVLILCTANSCRSQMAEGLANDLFSDIYDIFSAGTYPNIVMPEVITVLKEIGIDISHHRSKSMSEFFGQSFDYVITVCSDADRNCPAFLGNAHRIHWGFDDPSGVAVPYYGDELAPFRDLRQGMFQKFQNDWISTLL